MIYFFEMRLTSAEVRQRRRERRRTWHLGRPLACGFPSPSAQTWETATYGVSLPEVEYVSVVYQSRIKSHRLDLGVSYDRRLVTFRATFPRWSRPIDIKRIPPRPSMAATVGDETDRIS